ncbi:MAG TPA: FAD-dependent oxidoreductase [Chthonomonadaceae bacterium]|nr:FAD-dependent oxidoreductase [Chthonomonadaceae bacterium]
MGNILIIGGGVIGVCTAYFLAERGQQVTLIEQGDIAAGSSYGNAGLIVPSHSIPLAHPGALSSGLKWMLDPESPFYIKPRLNRDLISWLLKFAANCNARTVQRAIPTLCDLGCASLALYAQIIAANRLDCGFERKGLLMLADTPRGLEAGREEAHLLEAHGITAKALDRAGVRELEPNVRPEIVGGVYFPGDAHFTPDRFVRGLAQIVEQKGVCLRTQTAVQGLETAGCRIAKVRTTQGEFRADQVVLAAGSWSPGLARALRLNLPIQPAKGYSITVKRPATAPTRPLILSEARVAVTPMVSDTGPTLRFAGTLEIAGLDFSLNQRRVNAIRRAASRYLPGMENLETLEVWGGLRPCTPDGLPLLGRPPQYENLIIAAGHAMIGMSLGPITGKLVAQIACGETPELDLTSLRPERF